jgi:hypothetical protein
VTCAPITLTDFYGDWVFTSNSAVFTGHPNELCSGVVDAEYSGFAYATGTGMPFDGSARVRITGHVNVTGGTDPSIFIGLQADDETGDASGFDASSGGTNVYSWDDFDTDLWDLSSGIDFSFDWNPDANAFVAIIDGTTYTQTLGAWPVADRAFVISANGNNCGVTVSVTDICITIGAGSPAHESVTYQPTCLVFVDGDLLDDERIEAHTVHGFDTPVGTATVVLSIPRPASVLFNKVVEIHAQIGSQSARIFQGVIRADADSVDESGMTATLNCQGWAYILAMEAIADTAWNGPISARRVINSVLKSYGFGLEGAPQYEIHTIADPAGTIMYLGGNDDVDDGQVRWEKGESGLAFINRIANLWGYAGYDSPDGVFRVTRALGIPTKAPAKTWNEGSNVITFGRARTADPIANWIEVTGASALPDDGTRPDPYFSAPSVAVSNALIPEPGVKFLPISDDLLISDDLCDAVRAVAELRYNSAAPATLYDWTAIGEPRLHPGKVVRLNAASIGAVDLDLWLMSISQDLTADGYWSSYTGRSDTGDETSDDEICTTETLIAADDPQHLGDETLAYYEVPVPSGHVMHVDFTPADDFTSISLTYEAHGVNSYLIGGGNTGSDVSRFRIEQPVGTIIGSGVMPLAAENFGDPPTWQDFELPIPGALADGVLTRVFITSGNDARAVLGPYDDFEIRNLVVSTCTSGSIDDPGVPVNPPIPPPKPEPTPSVCWFEPPDVTVPAKASYGSLTIPVGTVWVWLHGDATGATGDVSSLGTYAAQGYAFVGAGLRRWLLEEGTATEADGDSAYLNTADVTGTPLVGAGAFDTFYRVSATGLADPVTVSAWSLNAPSGTPLSVSNVCLKFLALADWPY